MHFASFIILLCVGFVNLITAINTSWFDVLLENTVESFNFYQVSVVTPNGDETTILQPVFKKIVNKYPSIIINVKDLRIAEDNRVLNLPAFRSPTKTTLFVIIESYKKYFLRNLENTLNFIAKTSMVLPRPKCLLIFFNNNASSLSSFNKLLYLSWKLKFLDFVVLSVNDKNNTIIFEYNPFTETYAETNMNLRTSLFHNKLQNMCGYQIKTIFSINLHIFAQRPLLAKMTFTVLILTLFR